MFLLYMLDVIHLIVTVLSDRPSSEWECDVTCRPIWSSEPFRHVSVWLLLSNGMDAMLFGGLGKRMVGGARDGDWRRWLSSSDITFLRKSQRLVKRHSYFMQAVWALLWTDCFGTYMVVTYPLRPLLSWKEPGNVSFDNMGLLRLFEFKQNAIAMLFCYILRALWHHKCKWIQLPLSENSLPKGQSELAMP